MSEEKPKAAPKKTLLGTGPAADGSPSPSAGDPDGAAAGERARAEEPPPELQTTLPGTGPAAAPAKAKHDATLPLPAGDSPADAPVTRVLRGPPANAAGGGADPFIGREFCGYLVSARIAEGGMGEIYLGEHRQLGRRGAIKILKVEFCRHEEVVERFYQEARSVNSIQHPNIVDVFDFGRDSDGRVFFVMEHLEGESLAGRLARGPMPWDEARPLIEQMLRALQAAHDKSFAHRDLKPENIFLRRRAGGEVTIKLLDFGIAKLVGGENVSDRLTRTGSMIGTPHYMSPEQINGAADLDHRTDIYSLGVILYEMFAGTRPFGGETLDAIIKGHLLNQPPPLKPAPGLGVPAGLAAIVERMLAKDPADRYGSVSEVAADLRDVAADRAPSRAGTLASERPLSTREDARAAPAPRSRRTGLLVGAGLAIAAAAAAILYAGAAGRDPDPVAHPPAGSAAETPTTTTTTTTTATAPDPAVNLEEARASAQAILRDSLREVEPELRGQAADSLGRARDRVSVPSLVGLVAEDPDQAVRGRAAGALGRIGDPAPRPELEAARARAAAPLQVWIDEALHALGDARARARLLRAAGSSDLEVAFKAALALAETSEADDRAAIKALTRLAAREAELTDVAPYAGVLLLTHLAALRHAVARDALLAALTAPDEGARVAAAEGLARLGDDRGKDALTEALADERSPNRLVAARALVLLGDYSGYELLNEKLADEDEALRRQAAAGLGEVGEKDSLEPLLGRMAGDSDKAVKIAAAAAVLAIVGLDPTLLARASVDWARSALASSDWAMRDAAARTLGDIPEERAIPLLAQAVVDPNPEVRRSAARSAARLRGREAARQVALAAARERDPSVKEAQVRALGAIRDPIASDTLTAIADEPGRLGVLASGALVALGELAAFDRVVQALRDRSAEIRLAAAESAVLASNPIAVPALVTGASDTAFPVRFASAEGLADYRAEQRVAAPILEEGLMSSSPLVQARARRALLLFGVLPPAGPSPAEMLDSADPAVRAAAIRVIAALGFAEAAPLLRRALANPDPGVRWAAVDALVPFAGDEREAVVRMLRPVVDDADPATRAKAQAQLSKLTAPAADPGAGPAAGPGDPDDAGDAQAALDNLRALIEEVRQARAEVDEASEALARLAADIATRTGRPAEAEEDLDRVIALGRQVGPAAARVRAGAERVEQVAAGARAYGRSLARPEAEPLLEELGAEVEAARAAQTAARGMAAQADRQVRTYRRAESADPALYLTAAKTAIATGRLTAARRDLRRAEALFRDRGRSDPDIHFAWGELESKLAAQARTDRQRLGHLTRARAAFERFAATGAGFRVNQARELAAEINREIASLRTR